MPLLEMLTITVGTSVAKTLASVWLGDNELLNNASASISDVFGKNVQNVLDRRKVQRQFDRIAEEVATRLEKLVSSEFRSMPQNEKEAAVLLCSDVLRSADLTIAALVSRNLDPSNLDRVFRGSQTFRHQAPLLSEDAQELSLVILRECSNYIIEVALTLPNFKITTIHEILKREDQILETVKEVLDNLPQARNPRAGKENTQFETQYRRDMARNFDSVELFGLTVSESARRYTLSTAYITLQAEVSEGRRSREYATQEQDFDSFSLDRVLEPVITSLLTEHPDLTWSSAHKIVLEWAQTPEGTGFFQQQREHFHENGQTLVSHQSNDVWDQSAPNGIDKDFEIRVDAAVRDDKRLLVRGQAGSGKTTLLRWLAVNSSRSSFHGPLEVLNETLPFLIQLRRFSGGDLPSPADFVKQGAKAISGQTPSEWVEDQLRDGRALVLVDGVDEVPVADRHRVRGWLEDLVQTYPRARYLVTTRPSAVTANWLIESEFKALTLAPMSRTDVALFIDHWHRAASEKTQDADEREVLADLSRGLKSRLADSQALRSLASSPLLCAMLCALNRDRRTHLPRDRIQLYRVALEMLLERRDQERDVLDRQIDLTLQSKEQVLQHLALWLMVAGRSDLEKDRAIEVIQRRVSQLVDVTATPASVYEHLVNRSGVLREPAEGRVDFIHRTFQEYLAAKEAVEVDHIELLIEKSIEDQWRETVVLAAGLGNQRQRESLISGLLGRGEREVTSRPRLHLLSAACQEASPILAPEIRRRVETALAGLVPPQTLEEATALAAGGDTAVMLLQGFHDAAEDVTRNCIRCLSVVASEAALAALVGYANDTRPLVQRELIRAWSAFEADSYAAHVLSLTPFPAGLLELTEPSFAPYVYRLTNINCISWNVTGSQDLSILTTASVAKHVTVRDDLDLIELSQLEGVPQLEALALEGCTSLRTLTGIPMTELRHLAISGCLKLEDLDALSGSPCETLSILRVPRRFRADSIRSLSLLTELRLEFEPDPRQRISADVERARSLGRGVSELKLLQRLGVSGVRLSVTQIPTSVEFLDVVDVSEPEQFGRLGKLRNLRLDAAGVSSLSALQECQLLEELMLNHCSRLKDIEFIETFDNLNVLALSGISCSCLTSLTSWPAISQLTIECSTPLPHLQWLSSALSLQRLNISRVDDPHLGSLASGLIELAIDVDTASFEEFGGASHLETLSVSAHGNLRDLHGLELFPALRQLKVTGCVTDPYCRLEGVPQSLEILMTDCEQLADRFATVPEVKVIRLPRV